MRIGEKGFTFGQIATLLLVVLGLVMGVIIASTQLRSGSQSLSSVGSQVTSGTDTAVAVSKGLACGAVGGTCATSDNAYDCIGNPSSEIDSDCGKWDSTDDGITDSVITCCIY